jgi:hypothetical protein
MNNRIFAVAALMLASLGCDGGEEVALNGRLFDAQTMQSQGGGCSIYMLGSKAWSGGSAHLTEFVVAEDQTETAINVTVTRGSDVVVTRQYDAAFFQAGTLDQFVAPSTSGNDLLLRYWGKYHPGGIDGCTPLEATGPQ